MNKKQNKKLTDKKNPQDDDHLAFSISSRAKSFDWGFNFNPSIEDEDDEEDKKETIKIEKTKSDVGKIKKVHQKKYIQQKADLKVHNRVHKTSPYIVRLLDEDEAPYSDLPERQAQTKSLSNLFQKEDGVEWVREVERLRKSVSDSSKSAKKIYINLLSSTKPQKTKAQNRKKIPLKSYPFVILRAIAQWIFEFILSIPLGFLLLFEVILKLVNFFNNIAISLARLVGKSVSLIIEQSLFFLIAAIKALIAIPIKLVVLLFAGLYKTLSSAGYFVSWFSKAAFESVANYLSVFLSPPKHFYRKLFSVMVLCALVILPVKFLHSTPEMVRILQGKVLGATRDGYGAIASVDSLTSQEQLQSATQKFSEAREGIESLNVVVRGIISILPQGQDGIHAIAAGEDLSQAALLISQAISGYSTSNENQNMVEFIKNIKNTLLFALPKIESASDHLSAIDLNSIPDEYKEKFTVAKEILPKAKISISEFINFSDTLLEIIGDNGTKRYVVLFQNNNELRPAGGFIGSFAFIDVTKGAIENIKIPGGGPYDLKGYLTESVASPKPLQLINARWEMQDANWYANWPTSAEKVAWFLEKSGESSVDGVIALQATTLEKLLEILGPIYFEEYDVTINSENVILEMQKEVELNYDKAENQPKKYVSQLAPKVIEKILSSSGEDLIKIISLLRSEIQRKDILVYFRDSEINNKFIEMGMEPTILNSSMDYLSVVHANIGGGKTDGVIEETWNQRIIIDTDGTAYAELEIVRKHNGDPNDIFEGKNNVDYVRVYVPEGSELISFEGVKLPDPSLFEKTQEFYTQDSGLLEIEKNPIIDEKSGTRITNEFGKTVFGNWLQVDPGNVLHAKIIYKLPFKIFPFDFINSGEGRGYSILVQKQPGARDAHYSISLEYPADWNIAWKKTTDEKAGNILQLLGPGLALFEGDLSHDVGFAALFEKE